MGRILIISGVVMALIGAAILLLEKTSFPFGRLPGDIVWRGKNTTFYFPLATSIIASIVLTLLFSLFNRR